jgi:hypothetical protein
MRCSLVNDRRTIRNHPPVFKTLARLRMLAQLGYQVINVPNYTRWYMSQTFTNGVTVLLCIRCELPHVGAQGSGKKKPRSMSEA